MLKLRIGVWLSVALSMMLVVSAVAGTVDKEIADSDLEEINESGITADILFVDTGTELSIVGVATGLDPAFAYFSLIYDVESPDDGPLACEPIIPPGEPGHLDDPTMVVGFWHPLFGSSTRTLSAIKPAVGGNTNFGLVGSPFETALGYTPLDTIGTISIRSVEGPPPAGFVLQACGDL